MRVKAICHPATCLVSATPAWSGPRAECKNQPKAAYPAKVLAGALMADSMLWCLCCAETQQQQRAVKNLLLIAVVMVLAGASAGLLGIGGALIFNPLLLSLGVHPLVGTCGKAPVLRRSAELAPCCAVSSNSYAVGNARWQLVPHPVACRRHPGQIMQGLLLQPQADLQLLPFAGCCLNCGAHYSNEFIYDCSKLFL